MFRVAMGLLSLALFLFACAPVRVTTEMEPNVDLSAYRTYRAVQPEADASDVLSVSPAIERRLASEIDAGLEARGYRPSAGQEADLIVSFLLSSEQEVRLVNASDPDTDYYVPKKFWNDTLTVSLFDAATGERVWRGRGAVETMIGGAIFPESRERSLTRTARKVLDALPERRANAELGL